MWQDSCPKHTEREGDHKISKQFYVYILAGKRSGTLYVGVTTDIVKRIRELRQCLVEGFTKRYGVKNLFYFEVHQSSELAITRENQIKKWDRAWEIHLIEKGNPNWDDQYEKVVL